MIKSESNSRRVKITKRMLKDALMELLSEKQLSSVSITELCNLAEVNRSTFYSYYDDISQLLKEVEDDLIDQIPEVKAIGSDEDFAVRMVEDFTAFFAYIRHHSNDFSVLLQNGRVNFIDSLMHTVESRFPQREPDQDDPLQTHMGYIYSISGVIGIMTEWIKRDYPMSDRSFAEFALKMCLRANNFSKEL